MNFAHLHLVLTHFPPVLSIVSVIAAAIGIASRRREAIRLALILLIAGAAMMPLVYFAGEHAADAIGKVDGVDQEAIAPHEHAAGIAIGAATCSGVAAALMLALDRRQGGDITGTFRAAVLVAAIAAAVPIGWAAALGGAIHHPEIHDSGR